MTLSSEDSVSFSIHPLPLHLLPLTSGSINTHSLLGSSKPLCNKEKHVLLYEEQRIGLKLEIGGLRLYLIIFQDNLNSLISIKFWCGGERQDGTLDG